MNTFSRCHPVARPVPLPREQGPRGPENWIPRSSRGMFVSFCLLLALGSNALYAENKFKFKRLIKLEEQGVQVSAMVLRLGDNQILSEISADKHLIPASTTKLALASQALETFGPDKKFTSRILSRGQLNHGVLDGDLIFYGGGDPALINENLVFLIDDVVRFGIKRVTGKFIVNNSLFGKIIPDGTRARAEHSSNNSYDSPLSSAAVNYSVLALLVTPGKKVGEKASANLEPYDLPSVRIVNSVKTTNSKSKTFLDVSRTTRNGKDIFFIKGNIPINESPNRIYRSVSNPDRYAGETIMAYLQHRGVQFDQNQLEIETTPLLKTDKIVAMIHGYPLSEQLNGLLQLSNNFIADMLLLNLSLVDKRFKMQPESSLQDHGAVLEHYMQSLVQDDSLVLKSGSGLTSENRLSARNLVDLLKIVYLNSSRFKIFLNSLTSPGQIGTLQHRFKKYHSQNELVSFLAKSGGLTEPRATVSLAGYIKTPKWDWVSFAFIMNGGNSKHSPNANELRDALDADLTAFIQSGISSL